jgi:molybdenum cofactor biosynthesis protein B
MTLPPGASEHKAQAESLESARCAVLTVSDSRTLETDESGRLIQHLLTEAGHRIVHYAILPNSEAQVTNRLRNLLAQEVDAIILTGGTGLGRKDRTVEAVRSLIEKEIPGFGELFRWLSFQEQVGTAAILSRAVCGGVQGRLLVSLPGSRAAVDLALRRILLPELRHLLWEMRR